MAVLLRRMRAHLRDPYDFTVSRIAGEAAFEDCLDRAAALGSCIALYVQQFCETRELPYAGMKIEVRQKNEKNPNRVGKFAVTLVMPEQIPEQYAAMLERVVQSCPVHNTLVEGAEMTVDILVPAGHAS